MNSMGAASFPGLVVDSFRPTFPVCLRRIRTCMERIFWEACGEEWKYSKLSSKFKIQLFVRGSCWNVCFFSGKWRESQGTRMLWIIIHFNCSPLWTLINLTFYLYHVCHSAPQKSSVSFKRHLMVSLGGLRLIKSFEKKCVNRNGSGLNQSGVSSPDAKTTTPSSFELIVGGCVILLMQEILYAYLYILIYLEPETSTD